MRAGVYRAVRWRSGGASFALWTQMAARVASVTALVWAAITFGLVWYWTGYYGGAAAHRYFWLWILTWFFTENHSTAVWLRPVSWRTLPAESKTQGGVAWHAGRGADRPRRSRAGGGNRRH